MKYYSVVYIYRSVFIHSFRKVVQRSPFPGQEWRHRHREQTCGRRWGRRGRDELGAVSTYCNDHVADDALITWLIMHRSRSFHALITCLSCTNPMAHHALTT